MTAARGPDIARSVRQRLLNLARETGADFNALLVQFTIERALYRISISPRSEHFVLKGALLFRVWFGELHRPTLDVDLLGYGDPAPSAMKAVFRETLGASDPEDGIEFDLDSIRVDQIRGRQEYRGVRVRCTARLGSARIPLQVDIGFGDVIVPGARAATLPTLLGHAAPEIAVYSPESLVAEKLHALVVLGIANSRMKDLYDSLEVSRRFELEGQTLAEAIRATFERRTTTVPVTTPVGLTRTFSGDVNKRTQWAAFRSRLGIEGDGDLSEVVLALNRFLGPPLAAAREGAALTLRWEPSTGWR